MSKFISRRTTLLNNVKKFLPEKLLDREFLQNVGLGVDEQHTNGVSRDLNHYLRNCSLLGIYYGKLEEENIINPLQTLSMNNARKKVFVIESGYFAGQKKKYCLKQNIIPKHRTNSSEEERAQKEEQIEKEKRRFYRQCFLLKDLKHPNIINIVAGFEGMQNGISNSLCMAMPFYKNGDLGKWIADHPPHTRLLSVCYPIINGTLEGLHHLHQNDIVHCDIKPENIFLNDNLQPIIGDFDDAKEINTNVTQTLPFATFRYIAPEIVQAIREGNMMIMRCNEKTDMYAFGILVDDLLKGVEMSVQQKQESQKFIKDFETKIPNNRPSASQALTHKFLDLQANKETLHLCEYCTDSYLPTQGVWCCLSKNTDNDIDNDNNERHFICMYCINTYTRTVLEQGSDGRVQNTQGRIPCWIPGCNNPPVPPLKGGHVQFWEPETFEIYRTAMQRHTEQRLRKEMEEEYKAKLKKDLEKSLLDLTVSKHVHYIQDELLTLKCPKYGHAFFDFDGCAALKCSTCSCYFCAYCLTESNTDSNNHTHVRTCNVKKRLTNDNDPFFASSGGIEIGQCFSKSLKTKDYWDLHIKIIPELEVKKKIKDELIKCLGSDISISNHWDWLKQQ
eukprot:Pgem_evm2s19582